MTTNRRPRRDPLEEVVDIDSLKAAHSLVISRPDYWEPGTVPPRPLGIVPFEGLRQIATFAVPVIVFVLGLLLLESGWVYTIPVAFLIGYLLDKQLTNAIARKRAMEMHADHGRYAITRGLCYRLNLRPEEITPQRVMKMAQDFVKERERLTKEWRAIAARSGRPARRAAPAAAAAAGVAGAAYASDVDFDMQEAATGPAVNPMTGLPMISNSNIDVAGNVYGTDWASHDSFSSPFPD